MHIDPQQIGEMRSDIKHIKESLDTHIEATNKRIYDLENEVSAIKRWQAFAAGGAAVAGTIAGATLTKVTAVLAKFTLY